MRRFAVLFLTICLLMSLPACANSEPDDAASVSEITAPEYPAAISFKDFDAWRANRDKNPVSEESLQAISQFSYDTAALVLQNDSANSCYSPLSLYFALSLAGSGADGQTREELFALLGASDTAELAEQCGNLYRLLYMDNEISQLKIANSLWLDADYKGEEVKYKEDFTKTAASEFYASLFRVDFADADTGDAMADWIAENTNHTLTPEFSPDPEQIMSIINTVYFRAEWVDRFDAGKTKPDSFHLADGSDVTCDFMNMIYSSSNFSVGDDFTRSALQLKSNGSMVFVLPDEGIEFQDLLSSPDALRELFEGGTPYNGKVTWKIPKFEYDSNIDLADTLKKLGVTSAFGENADFSGITDHTAFISSIIQNTHIAIDEKGVEASAFTKIEYAGAAVPDGQADMILDRPFLYGIYTSAGDLIFIGICGDPS